MQLRDAQLGDPEHLTDLPQGQLLVVVERDDELLALGEARDRLGERLASPRSARARPRGSGAGLVLDRVDERDLSRRLPDGDQSSSSAAIDEREISSEAVVELLRR